MSFVTEETRLTKDMEAGRGLRVPGMLNFAPEVAEQSVDVRCSYLQCPRNLVLFITELRVKYPKICACRSILKQILNVQHFQVLDTYIFLGDTSKNLYLLDAYMMPTTFDC